MDKFIEKAPILTVIHIEQMKYEAKFATNFFKIAVWVRIFGHFVGFLG